jgi:hypothetical protein
VKKEINIQFWVNNYRGREHMIALGIQTTTYISKNEMGKCKPEWNRPEYGVRLRTS